jgi:hypothetical protein
MLLSSLAIRSQIWSYPQFQMVSAHIHTIIGSNQFPNSKISAQAGRECMDTQAVKQEIDALIAELGDETNVAKPAAERAVLEQIRLILDHTRDQHTGSSRDIWEAYLPYAAKLSYQLSRLEEGWEDTLEYFASENAQFWLDNASASLEHGDITGAKNSLGQITDAARMVRRDMIFRVDVMLQALEIALEISDKKSAIRLYEEAEKVYRKNLTGSDQYTGSAWLPKIKKMGRQLAQYQEKLRRYFQHAETVTFAIEADTARDLERVIETLQENLSGRIKITRRIKEADGEGKSSGFRARLKITLE